MYCSGFPHNDRNFGRNCKVMTSLLRETPISKSLCHAVNYLIKQQSHTGGWNSIAEPRVFETALATLALLSADSDEKRVISACNQSKNWLQTAIAQDHDSVAFILESGLLQLVLDSKNAIDMTDARLWDDTYKRKFHMLAILAHSRGINTRPVINIEEIIHSDKHYTCLDQLKPWARTDVIALRLLVTPPSLDNSNLLNQLVAAQSEDGSFHQMIVSSSLAFIALNFHNQRVQAWHDCLNYLLRSQQTCGTWLYPDWSVWNTTLVLRTFWQHSRFQQCALHNAVNFLVDTQQADGGWGFDVHSQPDNDTTSCALLALSTTLPNYHQSVIAGLEFIRKHKLESGLWRTWRSVDDKPAQDVIAHIVSALKQCSDDTQADSKQAIDWLCQQYTRDGFWQADWFVPPPFAICEISAAVGYHRHESQSALDTLIYQQNCNDGGWSSVSGGPTTAAATGSAVAALTTARSASDGSVQRGVDFLLQSQTEQGDWPLSPLVLGPRPLFSAEKINNLCLAASGLIATAYTY